MVIVLLLILAFFILIEGTITSLPLTFLFLLSFVIVKREMVFPVAFFAGIFLDLLTLRPLGTSSLFFVTVLFFVLLYQRKYEINSYGFVGAASFIGSLVFLLLFGYKAIVVQAMASSLLGLLFFRILTIRQRSSITSKKYK